MRKILISVLCLMLCSCAGIPGSGNNSGSPPSRGNFKGVQFGLCHAGYSGTDEEYAHLDQLGAQWLRIDFRWSRIEPEKGVWDFSYYDEYLENARAHGRKVLAILDYDTPWLHKGSDKSRRIDPDELPLYLEYVRRTAERYGSEVGAFEIWNEPNTKRFWTGSDRDFFELVRQSLDVLDEVSPDTPVAVGSLFYHPLIGAGLYLRKLINSGVLEKADALSLHPYTLSPSVLEKRIKKARNLIESRGYSVPVWITEAGFPTGGNYPNRIKTEEQGRIIAESLTGLISSGAEMVIWYCMYDSRNREDIEPGMSSEDFFGILWPDHTWKPGAFPYSILAGELENSLFLPGKTAFTGQNLSSLFQRQFLSADGTEKTVMWSTGRDVILDYPSSEEEVMVVDLLTGDVESISEHSRIVITENPVLLKRR